MEPNVISYLRSKIERFDDKLILNGIELSWQDRQDLSSMFPNILFNLNGSIHYRLALDIVKEYDNSNKTEIGRFAIVVEGKSAFTKTYSAFEMKELEVEVKRLAEKNKSKVFIVQIAGVLEQKSIQVTSVSGTLFGNKVEYSV